MNRRTFISTTIAASAASAAYGATPAADLRGQPRANLPTPALLLDLDAFEANLSTMADQCRRTGREFRPHAKTHKCPQIACRQLDAGAVGVCVATVSEAEAMAAAGISGILLTSPIVQPAKIARMVALAEKRVQVLLSVGHPRQVELLGEAARNANTTVDVLIDLDVGDRRTGVLPGRPALELARLVANSRHLRLRGLQAYAGHASHVVGFERRQTASQQAWSHALATRDLIAKAGLKFDIVSGGSTGTYNIDSAIDGVTELQVGSYVFMDVDYRRIGGRKNAAVYSDFRPSLTVLSTVVSAAHSERVTIDAGTKALDTTVSLRPEALQPGLSYARGGDEFGIVTAENGGQLPRLGEQVEFIVPHCDPTSNLHDRLFAMRGGRVEAIWDIVARRDS